MSSVTENPSPETSWHPEIGDLVWAKVRSHPWWPARVFDPVSASQRARKSYRPDHILIAFFGDQTFNWLKQSDLIPFIPNFQEKVQQTSAKLFCSAVAEALVEIDRMEGKDSTSSDLIPPDDLLKYVRGLATAPLSWSDDIVRAARMRKRVIEHRDKMSFSSDASDLFTFLHPDAASEREVAFQALENVKELKETTRNKSGAKNKRKTAERMEAGSGRKKKSSEPPPEFSDPPLIPPTETENAEKATKRRKNNSSRKTLVPISKSDVEKNETVVRDLNQDLDGENKGEKNMSSEEKDTNLSLSPRSSPSSLIKSVEKKGRKRKSVEETQAAKEKKKEEREKKKKEKLEEKKVGKELRTKRRDDKARGGKSKRPTKRRDNRSEEIPEESKPDKEDEDTLQKPTDAETEDEESIDVGDERVNQLSHVQKQSDEQNGKDDSHECELKVKKDESTSENLVPDLLKTEKKETNPSSEKDNGSSIMKEVETIMSDNVEMVETGKDEIHERNVKVDSNIDNDTELNEEIVSESEAEKTKYLREETVIEQVNLPEPDKVNVLEEEKVDDMDDKDPGYKVSVQPYESFQDEEMNDADANGDVLDPSNAVPEIPESVKNLSEKPTESGEKSSNFGSGSNVNNDGGNNRPTEKEEDDKVIDIISTDDTSHLDDQHNQGDQNNVYNTVHDRIHLEKGGLDTAVNSSPFDDAFDSEVKSRFIDLNAVYDSLLKLSRSPSSWKDEYEILREMFLRHRSSVYVKSSKGNNMNFKLKAKPSPGLTSKEKPIKSKSTTPSKLTAESEEKIPKAEKETKSSRKRPPTEPKQSKEGQSRKSIGIKGQKRKSQLIGSENIPSNEPPKNYLSEVPVENIPNTTTLSTGLNQGTEVDIYPVVEKQALKDHSEKEEVKRLKLVDHLQEKNEKNGEKDGKRKDKDTGNFKELDNQSKSNTKDKVTQKAKEKEEEQEKSQVSEKKDKEIQREKKKDKEVEKAPTSGKYDKETRKEREKDRGAGKRKKKLDKLDASVGLSTSLGSQSRMKKTPQKSTVGKLTSTAPRRLPQVLHMKFPKDMALPSVSELRALFIRYGSLIPNSVRLNRQITVAQVAYSNPRDAEAALKLAGKEGIFGNHPVKFSLRYLPEPKPVKKEPDSSFLDSSSRPLPLSPVKSPIKPVSILKSGVSKSLSSTPPPSSAESASTLASLSSSLLSLSSLLSSMTTSSQSASSPSLPPHQQPASVSIMARQQLSRAPTEPHSATVQTSFVPPVQTWQKQSTAYPQSSMFTPEVAPVSEPQVSDGSAPKPVSSGLNLTQLLPQTSDTASTNANIAGDMMVLLQKVSTLVSSKPQ